MKRILLVGALASAFCGCDPIGPRCAALDDVLWESSEWISVPDAPVFTGEVKDNARAASGTSWFVCTVTNSAAVSSVKWMTTALGVYEVYVNGQRIGDEVLKPGFTHARKTRRSFTYDVSSAIKSFPGDVNVFAAEVSAGWWRDKIVNFAGKKSAFRGVLEFTFEDGRVDVVGTDTQRWKAGIGGSVLHAAIFDGEVRDARIADPVFGSPDFKAPEVNREFGGEILPSDGAEVYCRGDKLLRPVEAYVWKTVEGADPARKVFGRVVKARTWKGEDCLKDGASLEPGETLVIDFGQNCAAWPVLAAKAAAGTEVTVLPGEMLNDANGERSRGNDGPGGSVYRENLRCPHAGMSFRYICRGKDDVATPRFTFFGYRYCSVTVSAPATVAIASLPVSSIRQEMEIGSITTGDADVNQLISNVYWGQLSNYLSVPTDCPQRNERLGWTADTQVFCEAGAFNADTRKFFDKWMRDERDSQCPEGGFPGVAPLAQYGNDGMRLGWADAGVIVPHRIWRQFGDTAIIDSNWEAMERYLKRVAETKYRTADLPETGRYQWNDWLSLTKFESCAYKPELSAFGPNGVTADALEYWNYLGGCYWLMDSELMAEMAEATGRAEAVAKYRSMAAEARAYLKETFFATADGTIKPLFADLQTAALFALKLNLVTGEAKAKTIAGLRASIAACGGTLHTGFLGTSIVMDTLSANGCTDLAYALLLNHKFPGWLYSVDQGATTIWERWNSYTKETGFGPVSMNSFNHYAYGCVLAWIYKTAAGIQATAPGFKAIRLAPSPDRRLGNVDATYRSASGEIKSSWKYEGENWVWSFTVPEGVSAEVVLPDGSAPKAYGAGTHQVTLKLSFN